MDRRRQLKERLDVIKTTFAVALEAPQSEDRVLKLEALVAATEAAWAEYREAENVEQKRCSLRLIRGVAAPAARWQDRTRDPVERSAG